MSTVYSFFYHSSASPTVRMSRGPFLYRKLPVAPSIRAIVEFSVSYLKSSMRHKYPLMGIYTEYPELNIEKSCSYQHYGQLHNEDLHPILRVGHYRTTSRELSGADTVNCRGRVTVQDYIPRNFHLTFGFRCNWPHIYSLKGLWYNISFTRQTNKNGKYTEKFHTKVCGRLYQQTSLPNLIADESLDQIFEYDWDGAFLGNWSKEVDCDQMEHNKCHTEQ